MFHNFDLTTAPFLIKLTILIPGFLLGNGFDMIVLRSRRNRAKKELIPATAHDRISNPAASYHPKFVCFSSRRHLHRTVICLANHAVKRGSGYCSFVDFIVF